MCNDDDGAIPHDDPDPDASADVCANTRQGVP
jgi:hypothetical protein